LTSAMVESQVRAWVGLSAGHLRILAAVAR
jgi:hypothetical protein